VLSLLRFNRSQPTIAPLEKMSIAQDGCGRPSKWVH
jgi:hypothetical protein